MNKLLINSKKIAACFIIFAMILMTVPAALFAQSGTLNVTMGVERVSENSIVLTAESSGGTNVQYRFDKRVMGNGGAYTMIRDYDQESVFTWNGAEDGESYEMVVHALSQEGDYKGYYVVFVNVDSSFQPRPFEGVAITATKVGSDILLEADVTGGSNVIYKFEFSEDVGLESPTYKDVRGYDAYSSSHTYLFTQAEPGKDYYFVVHACEISSWPYVYNGGFTGYYYVPVEGTVQVTEVSAGITRADGTTEQISSIGSFVVDLSPGKLGDNDRVRTLSITASQDSRLRATRILYGAAGEFEFNPPAQYFDLTGNQAREISVSDLLEEAPEAGIRMETLRDAFGDEIIIYLSLYQGGISKRSQVIRLNLGGDAASDFEGVWKDWVDKQGNAYTVNIMEDVKDMKLSTIEVEGLFRNYLGLIPDEVNGDPGGNNNFWNIAETKNIQLDTGNNMGVPWTDANLGDLKTKNIKFKYDGKVYTINFN